MTPPPEADLSAAYLASPAARASLRVDPYWPKWDSPWWHMTLLWELGLAERIPASALDAMLAALKTHYLPGFPLRDSEIPPGKDESRHVLCHCALGTIDQVFLSRGVDLRRELPWAAGWYPRYQLPDGGLNCEKDAYHGSRKSSPLSTLPCLEAVLARAPALSAEDERFLDAGARYLVEHRLVRSTKGLLIDPAWLLPCFPRFYEYDVLRGARFLLLWSRTLGRPLPAEALEDARPWLQGRPIVQERRAQDKDTLLLERGGVRRAPATRFALLDAVDRPGEACPYIRLG